MSIREPAVAGQFYVGGAAPLRRQVQTFLDAAPIRTGAPVQALIAPHAGYVYSGPVAGSAFAALRGRVGANSQSVRRVILLGPTHTVDLRGLAVSRAEAFRTPLGNVPVDRETVARLGKQPAVLLSDRPHAREHAIEVELPFLQEVLREFSLVPIVVGRTDAGVVADILTDLWADSHTLVVVSSDLSHYLPYSEARELDDRTARSILALRPEDIKPSQACGHIPICGLLRVARERGLTAECLDLQNSGDTAGGRDQVVGYGAFAFA